MTQHTLNEDDAQNGHVSSADASAWYLRTEDQEVYGPIALHDLQAWAEEGRIAPEHQLSKDRESWVNAESIPDLRMDWVAETPDGRSFGPFPLAAMTDFLKLGVTPPESKVINRRTGESSTMGQLVQPLLDSPIENAPVTLAVETIGLNDEVDALRRQLIAITAERDAALTSRKELEDSFLKHQAESQNRDGKISDELKRKEADWKQRLSSMEAGLSSKEKDLLARQRELEVKLAEAIKFFNDERIAHTADQKQADDQERVFTARYAELEKKLQSTHDDLARAEAKQRQIEKQKDSEWSARLAQVETGLSAKETDLLAVQREVEAKLAKALAELTEFRSQRSAEVKVATEKQLQNAARIAELERQLATARTESVRVEEQRKQLELQKDADWAARLAQVESRLTDKDADIQAARREMETRLAEMQLLIDQAGDRQATKVLEFEQQLAAARRDHDKIEEQRLSIERQLAVATAEWTARESRLLSDSASDKNALREAHVQAEQFRQEVERLAADAESQRQKATEREREHEVRLQEAHRLADATVKKSREQLESMTRLVHEQESLIEKGGLREKELVGKLDQLTAALARSRVELEEHQRAQNTLRDELARRDAHIAAQQMQARSLLFDEVSQREQELAQEEKLTLSVQSALQRRKDNLKRYMSNLEKLVEGPFDTQKELFEKQQAALEKLPLIEAELEQARIAEREAQDRALRVGAESQSAIEQLRGENQSLSAREKQVLSDLEEQKTAMNELKERSRKIEQALNQRIERMQEENRSISRRLGDADLEIEKLTKLRIDMEETLQQKFQEFQQASEQHERDREEMVQREQELTRRLEEMQINYLHASTQIEQFELSTGEREASWLARYEQASAEKDDLVAQLEAWQQRAENNDESLQRAMSEIEELSTQVQQLDALRLESETRLANEHYAMQAEHDRLHAEWQRATEAWQVSEAMRLALEEDQKQAVDNAEGLQLLLQAEQEKVRDAAEKSRVAVDQWNEQLRALTTRVEQQQKQLAEEHQRTATRVQEIEALRKSLHDEQQKSRQLDQEFEKLKAAMKVEEDRTLQRDEELSASKKSLLEEQARRHALEEKLLPQEKLIQDAQERTRQLEEELGRERESVRESQEASHLRQVEITMQLEALQGEHRDLEARFDEAVQELEQRRLTQDDEQRQNALRQEYLQQQLELMQQESEKLSRQYEETLSNLDQQKIRLEDELEGSRVQSEDLQHRIEQLRQENQSLSLRFEQQKKFYDEERELRRQREVELQTQRKTYQELTGTVRQKEQSAVQQRKISEETLARAQQKEEVLNRRLEQLQSDWRTTLTRLEQAERELMQFRRGASSGASAETSAATAADVAARRPRPETPPPPPPARKFVSTVRPLPPPPVPAKPRAIIPKESPRETESAVLPGASEWMQDNLSLQVPGDDVVADKPNPPAPVKTPAAPPKPRRIITSTEIPAPLTNTKPQIRLQ